METEVKKEVGGRRTRRMRAREKGREVDKKTRGGEKGRERMRIKTLNWKLEI